jgi:hypothetical protein
MVLVGGCGRLRDLRTGGQKPRLGTGGFPLYLTEPPAGRGQLLDCPVVLLADRVHLGLEAVHLLADLGQARLRGCPGRSGIADQRSGRQQRGPDHATAGPGPSRT